MTADRWSQIIRIGTLLGLLAVFIGFLLSGLARDLKSKSFVRGDDPRAVPGGGIGRLADGQGRDKGVRVLVMNRNPPDGPIHTHDRVTVEILQPVEIWAGDDGKTKPEVLKSGATLRIELLGLDGFLLSSPDFLGGPKDLKWAVQSLWIVPRDTEPLIEHLDADGNPKWNDPRMFEAANRRAVFRLSGIRADLKPQYRGSLQILWRSAKELALINHLPMEAYIEGVTAFELSPAHPLEALKAQAIASRGFAWCRSAWAAARKDPYDLVDTRQDQDYGGAGYSTSAVIRAVYETRGIVPVIHGAPFLPLFSAASGGFTESVDHVFPGMKDLYQREALGPVMGITRDEAYERAVETLGKQQIYGRITVDLRPQEDLRWPLAKYLSKWNRQVGYINQIRIGKRDPVSGRVQTVLIYHSSAEQPIELSATLFRDLIGPQKLKSTMWTADSPKRVEVGKNFVWRITTIGWGHGVGMSQISACQLAREGMSAKNILSRFYAGMELRTLW